ncbi:hypothetical protein Tco_0929899 [Tanacetum coccineum]
MVISSLVSRDGNWKSYRSKEDQTQSISQSSFVTNFPDQVTARDLWKVYNDYGVVVDAFIPYKKLKQGKVKDITTMPLFWKRRMGGLWVLIETVSTSAKEKLLNHTSVGSWFSSLKPACNSFVNDERVVCISLEGLPLKVCTRNTFAKVASKWGDLVEWEDLAEKSLFCKRLCVKTKLNEIIAERFKVISSDEEEDAEDDKSQSGDKVTADNDVERASMDLDSTQNSALAKLPLLKQGTDITKITRKQSKTGKHGHGKRKSTREAKDSKPKPEKVKLQSKKVKP